MSYSVNRLGEVSFGIDIHRVDYGMALLNWILKVAAIRGTLWLGFPALGVYPNPIYRIRYTYRGVILWNGYPPGGVRGDPIGSKPRATH